MHRGLLAMDTTAPQLLRTSMCLPARAEYSYAAQISSREDGSPLACSLRLRGGGESSIVEESNYEPSPTPGDMGRKGKMVSNMPYDEALELSQVR